MRALAALIVLLASLTGAAAETLIVTVSRPEIAVRSNFSGATLVVFGGIQRDRATVARQGYDIVVTVRGPGFDTTVRRKDRVFGLWVNRKSRRYQDLPGYYAVLATRPIEEVASRGARLSQRIGIDTLLLRRTANDEPLSTITTVFGDALIARRTQAGLYDTRGEAVAATDQENPPAESGVTFLSDSLFRASLDLPAEAPIGVYEVDVHLFSGGARLASETASFSLRKEGFEETVSGLSRERPAVYGLMTVLLAFFTGWLGSVVFRRD